MNYTQTILVFLWWNYLDFSNNMGLTVRMIIFNNLKHLTAICLRFEERLFTFLTMLSLKSKPSICSAIKEKSRFKGAPSGRRKCLATESINFKIYHVTIFETNNGNTHIAQYL